VEFSRPSVEQALGDAAICIDAAIPEERPMLTRFLHFAKVAFHDEHFFLVMTRYSDHLAERIANERAPPELHRTFHSNAVGAATNTPFAMAWERWIVIQASLLFLSELFFLLLVPTDGRRVEEDLRAFQNAVSRSSSTPRKLAGQVS